MPTLSSGGDRRSHPAPPLSKWAAESERVSYSSKLLATLRRVRRSCPGRQPRSRAVKEVADRALAVAARGRTRWSRAILCSGLALKSRNRKLRPAMSARPRGRVATAAVDVVERKARLLGRLVPGCRMLPLGRLLEEASDYIAALEMQVRAMSAVAEALSAAGSSGGHVM